MTQSYLDRAVTVVDAEGLAVGGSDYKNVAAGQTDSVLGSPGAVGDWLGSLVVVVATAATSQVQIQDGDGAAFTVFPANPGGGVGTYNVQIGIRSVIGPWSVTTGAGVSVIAIGSFTEG